MGIHWLAAYQQKYISQIWYNQWNEGTQKMRVILIRRSVRLLSLISFPLHMREPKLLEFINLNQESMIVGENASNFT